MVLEVWLGGRGSIGDLRGPGEWEKGRGRQRREEKGERDGREEIDVLSLRTSSCGWRLWLMCFR